MGVRGPVCVAALAAALSGLIAPGAFAEPLPAAVITDPAPDKAYPARFTVAAMPTGGVVLPAMVYIASGPGPHPTVVLFHGLPGAENNLDLAQAIRRGGWNVVLFHYRGSWGSPGRFSFTHCIQDGAAAVAWLRDPKTAKALNADPDRIVLAGHSLGGFVAGNTGSRDPKVLGVALISSAGFTESLAVAPRADVIEAMKRSAQSADGLTMLGDVTPEALADDMIAGVKGWDLSRQGAGLARHPLLVVTSDDGLGDIDDSIAAASEAAHGAPVTRVHFATNHGYNDHRLALAGAVLRWLETLPGAPK